MMNPSYVTPLKAQWDISFKCNFRCNFCLTSSGDAFCEDLSTRSVYSIIDKIYDAGVLYLTILGGEPLYRKDILDIFEYAINKGMILSFSTNASLVNENVVGFIDEHKSAFQYIQASIYGFDEKSYRHNTGSSRNYHKVLKGMDMLASRGINYSALMVVTLENASQISEYYKMIKEYKVESFRLTPKVALGRAAKNGRFEQRGSCELWINLINGLRAFRKIYKMNYPKVLVDARPLFGDLIRSMTGFETYYQNCKAAKTMIYIDPIGRSSPCPFLQHVPEYLKHKYNHLTIDDLSKKNFSNVWDSKVFKTFRSYYEPRYNKYGIYTRCKYYKNGACVPCALTPCYCPSTIKLLKQKISESQFS